jgi:multiple sugar transport system substrate-binding protein
MMEPRLRGGQCSAKEAGAMKKSLMVGAALLALIAAGCGGGDGGSASTGQPPIKGAKVIDPASMDNPGKATVTFCTGKDTSGALHRALAEFNAKYRAQGLKANITEFPAESDTQRTQFIQRAQAKSSDCDLFYADDTWTAEFASQKWIYDLTPYVKSRAAQFVPSVLGGAKYAGRYWAVPKQTGAGFLYYRTDRVPRPPRTWQDLYAQAKREGPYAYQGAAYEGLTVNFLEVSLAAGGHVLSADGKRSVINSPENLKALKLMVDGIDSGEALKDVTTYMEEETRQAFEAGVATFMRNWPYAYPLGNMSKIKHRFAARPLPAFAGAGTGQVIGTRNLVASAYSKHPGAALRLADFMTSPGVEREDAVKSALAPVLSATYRDAAVKRAMPYSQELRQAVQRGSARPVSPVYNQISQAIYKNVNKALSGSSSPEDALKNADAQIKQALSSF